MLRNVRAVFGPFCVLSGRVRIGQQMKDQMAEFTDVWA